MHVNELEERLRETLVARENERQAADSVSEDKTANSDHEPEGEKAETIPVQQMEDRLRQAEIERQQAVSEALSSLADQERAERARALQMAEKRQRLAVSTRDAQEQWKVVKEVAGSELEVIKSNRDTLAILGASLDFFEAQVHISARVRIPPSTAAQFHLA